MLQMIMTCILMPYEIAASFFGFSSHSDLASVAGELEGSMVELGAASKDLAKTYADDEEKDGANNGGKHGDPPIKEQNEIAPATPAEPVERTRYVHKGTRKRQRRTAFLQRVRERRAHDVD